MLPFTLSAVQDRHGYICKLLFLIHTLISISHSHSITNTIKSLGPPPHAEDDELGEPKLMQKQLQLQKVLQPR